MQSLNGRLVELQSKLPAQPLLTNILARVTAAVEKGDADQLTAQLLRVIKSLYGEKEVAEAKYEVGIPSFSYSPPNRLVLSTEIISLVVHTHDSHTH